MAASTFTDNRKSIRAGELLTRIAVVNEKKCKPNKCKRECKKFCPVNNSGAKCIEVESTSAIAKISEILCTGCGICPRRCPFEAISIINLPKELEHETTYRYGPNSFKLHRLPVPRKGEVLGIVGQNGIGKSTALKILSGKAKMNFGRFPGDAREPPEWPEIIKYYRGSSLQNYFERLCAGELKVIIKPQFVDAIAKLPSISEARVGDLLRQKSDVKSGGRGDEVLADIIEQLEMKNFLDRQVKNLCGGELSKFSIAIATLQDCSVWIYDEVSSYLDIAQRLRAANLIRGLCTDSKDDKYVIVSEHDICLLDYLSDTISILYGTPSAYGVVAKASAVHDALNNFLSGHIPSENLRFRPFELNFRIKETVDDEKDYKDDKDKSKEDGEDKKNSKEIRDAKDSKDVKDSKDSKDAKNNKDVKDSKNAKDSKDVKDNKGDDEKKDYNNFYYPSMSKTFTDGKSSFKLNIEAGSFRSSQVIILLAPNGSGKSSMINILSGLVKPDTVNGISLSSHPSAAEMLPSFGVSVKPQKIMPSFDGTVRELLQTKAPAFFNHPQFQADVIKPLRIDELYDDKVKNLSGGQLQRVACTLSLLKPADIVFIDEPSTYLDVNERLNMAKVIKRFIMHAKKTAVIVEHDFLMSCYLADRVITFSGTPAVEMTAQKPQSLLTGMNYFLKTLDITFRRDPISHRPRINKRNSVKDVEQKKAGIYFHLDD